MRNNMKCKGTKKNQPCGNILCQTDGKAIFIKLASGREMTLRPRRALGIVCEECGYETTWYVSGMRGK